MGNDDGAECRKRYELFRHHAWAGLGILSVFLALQYFISLPPWISATVVCVLSAYILISLMGTYRYRKGLVIQEAPVHLSLEQEKIAVEKARMKLEKKRVKAEVKAKKKSHKK